MGAPHNKQRYGELWPEWRVTSGREVLEQLKDLVIVSGGWAWCLMSPEGHAELKHAHDLKDLDLFVPPESVADTMVRLQSMGFQPVWTRYDRLESAEEFRRYERLVQIGDRTQRLVIDFFVRDVPAIERRGFRVVDPRTLLTFYSNIHSSDKCFAVQAAARLVAAGKDPVDHPDLVKIPKL